MIDNVATFRTSKRTLKSIEGFGCGQVVQLNSGGALMTVRESLEGADKLPMVRCDWKTDTGEAGFADYYVMQLTRFEDLPPDGTSNAS